MRKGLNRKAECRKRLNRKAECRWEERGRGGKERGRRGQDVDETARDGASGLAPTSSLIFPRVVNV